MTGTKARELPSAIQHLLSFRPPDMTGRVRHDTIWSRLRAAADRGDNRTVVFDRGD